jgi:hypothetical protein
MPRFSDFPKICWSAKDKLDREALEGILGSFRWLNQLMVYFANFQHITLRQTYILAQPY